MKILSKLLPPDSVTAIAAAWDATMSFAKDALPPTENRIEAFKQRYPLRYARMKGKLLKRAERWLKTHPKHDIEAYCDFITDNEEDRMNLIRILTSGD